MRLTRPMKTEQLELAPDTAFKANPKIRTAPPVHAEADALIRSMLGRHCAGMAERPSASALRRALLAPPDQTDAAAVRKTCPGW